MPPKVTPLRRSVFLKHKPCGFSLYGFALQIKIKLLVGFTAIEPLSLKTWAGAVRLKASPRGSVHPCICTRASISPATCCGFGSGPERGVRGITWITRSSKLALQFARPLELEGSLWMQEGLCAFGANHSRQMPLRRVGISPAAAGAVVEAGTCSAS